MLQLLDETITQSRSNLIPLAGEEDHEKPKKKGKKKSPRRISIQSTDDTAPLPPEDELMQKETLSLDSVYNDVDDNSQTAPFQGDLSPSSFMHRPNFTTIASEPVNRIYLEKVTGFSSTTQRKITALGKLSSANNQVEPGMVKSQMTPLDLGLECQKVFHAVGVFCHGFLAGLAFWHLVIVYVLTESGMEQLEFLELYSPLSQPLHLMFFFLTVICTVSVLDRYDLAQLDWRQLQMMLSFRSGGIAIVVYVVVLVLTLVTTRIDDKFSLYQHNSTLFTELDSRVSFRQFILIDCFTTQHYCLLGFGCRNVHMENTQRMPLCRGDLRMASHFYKAKH